MGNLAPSPDQGESLGFYCPQAQGRVHFSSQPHAFTKLQPWVWPSTGQHGDAEGSEHGRGASMELAFKDEKAVPDQLEPGGRGRAERPEQRVMT